MFLVYVNISNFGFTPYNQHENKVSVAEMRMLCWMCSKTRRDILEMTALRR